MLDELAPDEKSDAERELAPSVDVPDESDADPTLQRQFWLLVLVFNVALMAVSVGAMLAVFRGQYDTGTSLVAAGLILSAYGFYKYRRYANADDVDDVDDADDADDEPVDDVEDLTENEALEAAVDDGNESPGGDEDDGSSSEGNSIADLNANSRE